MPNITVGLAKIHYEIHGSGEPLVLIPGFASGIWSWRRQIEVLSSHFRVLLFDPRGISNSTGDESGTATIGAIADDVKSLLEELNIERSHILGISFGGFVAQEFALKYAATLRKLVLASTSFGGKHHVSPSYEVLSAFAPSKDLNSPERIRKGLKMSFTPAFAEENAGLVEEFCNLREMNPVSESVYLQQLLAATTFDAEARVSQITADTLIVSGDRDNVVPIQNSENLAERLLNARLEIIRNGGHMAFYERADEFNDIVTSFLSAKD
jgi:pimeloyl-ACP methyl ester carboxylesterase